MAEQQSQGNIREEFNLGRIGLNMDASVNQVEKGKLTYALNAALENFDASSVNYQNEQGNEFCLKFPDGYQLIGEHFIAEQNKHLFFLCNPETGGSEIGYMDNNDCVYHTYINSDCLNFQINHPIHKAVHKIFECETEVYWTDGVNPRRYLNLNSIPYTTVYGTDGCDITTLPTIDCNKLNIQPNFNIPQLSIAEITTGGDLKAGTYQFAIQYANASGQAYTSYYSVTNPTPIANTDVTTLNFDYVVGRSIHIDISNIDVTGYFQYYNLAVIKTINAITSVELVGTYFIDSKINSITYTGQSKTDIRLTLNDIFEKYPYYEIAEDVTTARDVLIWDGLTSIDKVNLQKVANQIDLQWQTYRIPSSKNYSDEIVANKYRGYLRDEIYAFEIVFLLNNGKQTDGFHIPGRLANGNDLATVYESQNKDFIGTGPTAPYWKIYNTASVSGYSPEYVSTAGYEGPYQYGDFAYWESNEEYPCNTDVWGDLAGTKIRHHKFPDASVSPIFESPSPDYNNLQMQNSAIFPIGVNVNAQQVMQLIANSDLTDEQKASIVAFKIVRGDRSTNKSIVAKGMLRNVGKYNREGTDYYFPNYPYNDLNEDPFLLTKNNAYNSQCNTFKIVATEDITLQYIDCYTGNPTATTMVAGATLRQCSLTFPVAVPSTGATITNITTTSFTITVQRETTFFFDRKTATFTYLDPITESTATITVDYTRPQTVNTISTPVFASGSRKYTIAKNNNLVNTYCYPQNLDGFSSVESQFRYVFNSPETSFGQPYLGNVLKLENSIFGGGKSHFVSVKKHASYKLLTVEAQQVALDSCYKIANITSPFDYTAMFTAYQAYLAIYINGVTRKNYTYSFNSVAGYDYSAPIDNNVTNFYGVLGIKQRKLDISQYIIPGVQSVGDLYSVNNFNRESSVYLKTAGDTPLPFPDKTPNIAPGGTSLVSDNSRFTASTANTCSFPEQQQDINVVSYYASLKNVIDNQWGQIYSYDTIDTGFQALLDGTVATATVFGGDTFIGKFAYKTKIPFFIDNRVGAPDDSEVFYDELGNIAYPQYWYSSRSVLSDYNVKNSISLRNIISYKAHYLDCPNDPIPSNLTTTSTTTVAPTGVTSTVSTVNDSVIYDGKMYLFAYGIPFFYVESSINVDLRQAFNSQEGDFYPHVSTGIPDNWLQESVVPIAQDNTYYYNPTFSKQNKENYFSHLPIDWTPSECYTKYPFRAIYSDQQGDDPNAKVNNWLSYSPLSYFDFPQNYGPLVSLDGIQNKAVLARFENKSLLYNTLLTIDTSNPQAAYMGNPSLFRSAPPIDFAETDLGYVGSQNKMLLKIPQGQISVDAKRGQVFLISGNQAQDLSAFGSGLNRFFTDHLSFEILRYFPTVDVDNHFNGVGLHGVYDSKFDRIIITKLDYIPHVGVTGINYDSELNKFYLIRTVGTAPNQSTYREYIELTDTRYFCNKSWTLSFNMNSKSWVSFHSYIPNFYIAENNFFYSGLNESCDLTAVALLEIPTPSTTTTTTAVPGCALSGTACTSYPEWVNDGEIHCTNVYPCETVQPQKDINPCSPSYNETRDLVILPNTCPSDAPNWVNNGDAYCEGDTYPNCVSKQPQKDNNPCSPSYNETRTINGGSACNLNPVYENVGTPYCSDGTQPGTVACNTYQDKRQTNPCAEGYNEITPFITVQICNLDPVWVNDGVPYCYEVSDRNCETRQDQYNTNPCYTHVVQTRYIVVENICNTEPNWQNMNIATDYVCVYNETTGLYDQYYEQRDNNRCSNSYALTQTGDLYEAGAANCNTLTEFWFNLTECYTGKTFKSTSFQIGGANNPNIGDQVVGYVPADFSNPQNPVPGYNSQFIVTAPILYQDPGGVQIAVIFGGYTECQTTTTTTSLRPSYAISSAKTAPHPDWCNLNFPQIGQTSNVFTAVDPLEPNTTGTFYVNAQPGDSVVFNGGGYRWYIKSGDGKYHYAVNVSSNGFYDTWITCSGTNYIEYTLTLVGQADSALACAYPIGTSNQTVYAKATQTSGDLVTAFYLDPFCEIEFDGNDFWYAWEPVGGGTKYNGQLGNLGSTSNVTAC